MKDIEKFFIDDNDIFDHDEISKSKQKLIMDLIDRTNFIADTKKFIADTEAAKMEIADLTVMPEMEKRSRIPLTQTKKKKRRQEMKIV